MTSSLGYVSTNSAKSTIIVQVCSIVQTSCLRLHLVGAQAPRAGDYSTDHPGELAQESYSLTVQRRNQLPAQL